MCDPSQMLDRMKDGDVQVLDQITRCYGQRLLAVGRQRCGQRGEDAVQDALLSAGEHLTQFRGDGSLEGWLVRLVTNACHRMRRGRKNDPSWHAPMDDARGLSGGSTPDEDALRIQYAEALGSALLDLAPKDRMILLLSDAEDWRAPEIAEELDMTSGAVRTRLSRLRRRLRGQLAEVWLDEDEDADGDSPGDDAE